MDEANILGSEVSKLFAEATILRDPWGPEILVLHTTWCLEEM